MGRLCKDPSELWDGWEKIMTRWETSKTLEKWSLTKDQKFFKELFYDATEKDFELGVDINWKDLNKFDYVLERQIKQLNSPGDAFNKFKKIMWVGYAKAMKNPITKEFFHTLSDAGQFRHRHTAQNMKHYKGIMEDLKVATVLHSGQADIQQGIKGRFKKTKFDELSEKLSGFEREYVKQQINENKAEQQNASNDYSKIRDFLDGEGAVFEDFIQVLGAGNTKGLETKYKNDYTKDTYINKIKNAATKWQNIVNVSNKELNQAINNLVRTVDMKYGHRSPVAEKIIKRYKDVQKRLEDSKDKGYAPHYVLDLLKQSLEMREKLDLNTEMSAKEMDNILLEHLDIVDKVSVQLSPRLKSKSKDPIITEYFSRNPALYITQFVKDVSKFNYSTYVDRAYVEGIQKLSNVVFSNPGDATATSAEAYGKYLTNMYNESVSGRRLENSESGKNLHRLISSMQFVSKLGLNPRSALRNTSQSLFTWKWFGKKEWQDAINEYKENPEYHRLMKSKLDKYGLEYHDLGTITEGAITEVSLEGFGIEVRDGYLTRNDNINIMDHMTKAGINLADKSAVMMKWAENFNRKVTFKAAFGSRMKQLKKQTRFADYRDPVIQEKMAEKSGVYAARITELLHFQYGKHGKSELLKSKAGSIMFQFQHYTKSALNLEAMIYKDYWKAAKAGDYGGYEWQRVKRNIMLAAIANVVSIPLGINATSYLSSEMLQKIGEFVSFITGDEEERNRAFYGKGPIISQSVVLSDMVEIFNLGIAAGYWDVNTDPDNVAALLAGIREYEDIDDAEFARGVTGKLWTEGERLATQSIPNLFKMDGWNFLRGEFGLYPGETEIGINVRQARKKVMESKTLQDASDIYEDAFGTGLVKKDKRNRKTKLKPDEKRRALGSLARF